MNESVTKAEIESTLKLAATNLKIKLQSEHEETDTWE